MGIRSSLRNPDWLAELFVVLTVALVLATVGVALVIGRAAFGDSVSFNVPSGSIDGITEVRGPLRPNAAIDADGVVDVVVTDPTVLQRAMGALTRLPSYLLALAILALLWATVRTARRTDPFSPVIPQLLRWLGVVTLVGGLLTDMIQLAATFFGSQAVFDGFMSGFYRYSWWWMLVGVGFLATAEVVRRGVAMRAELDEVV